MEKRTKSWRSSSGGPSVPSDPAAERDIESLGWILRPEHPIPSEVEASLFALIEQEVPRRDAAVERVRWRPIRALVVTLTPILFVTFSMPFSLTGLVLAPSAATFLGWMFKRQLQAELAAA